MAKNKKLTALNEIIEEQRADGATDEELQPLTDAASEIEKLSKDLSAKNKREENESTAQTTDSQQDTPAQPDMNEQIQQAVAKAFQEQKQSQDLDSLAGKHNLNPEVIRQVLPNKPEDMGNEEYLQSLNLIGEQEMTQDISGEEKSESDMKVFEKDDLKNENFMEDNKEELERLEERDPEAVQKLVADHFDETGLSKEYEEVMPDINGPLAKKKNS